MVVVESKKVLPVSRILKERLNQTTIVKNAISKGTKQRCIKPNKKIGSKITVTQRIGTESINADVYKARFPYRYNIDLAVKLIPLSDTEKKLQEDRESLSTLNESLAWSEIYLLKMVSKLVTQGICPNLPVMYSYFTCNKCIIQNQEAREHYDDSHDCILVITELADGDLKSLLTNYEYTYDQLLTIYFQIYAALYAIRKYYNIWHQDLHWGNVLFHEINYGGYFKYIIKGTPVYIPNYGILPVLWDFGYARIPGIIENSELASVNAQNTNEYEDYTRITKMASIRNNKIGSQVYRDLIHIINNFENSTGIQDKFLLTVAEMVQSKLAISTSTIKKNEIIGTFNMGKKLK